MNVSEPAKDQAARAAAALVEDGMAVGLGSGSTARLMVQHLGGRVRREGLKVVGIATSEETATLAESCGIELCDVDDRGVLDLNIDGADEVDGRFRMIKGRGGALLREKFVASIARRRVTMIEPRKRVASLGQGLPVPVEVSPFGLRHTEARLRALGAATTIRSGGDGAPFVTDGGNRIVDCLFESIADPVELDRKLGQMVGVFETGLFIDLCDVLVVGLTDRAEVIANAGPREAQ